MGYLKKKLLLRSSTTNLCISLRHIFKHNFTAEIAKSRMHKLMSKGVARKPQTSKMESFFFKKEFVVVVENYPSGVDI